ncbi:preprotein translocase subunit SecE [Rothia terrae]|jgi:preprotein translocase subunit SecE|uniref:preprotein translocase subunit SecE n=1 Tax=Rothia terrae TaxID=396015 RepID=UPI0028819467|nr:preprotein translocase subunit SecE [Rothia terrae]MDT0189842.1 preprotein translocase subunit SecE [Rothia terrae]
MAKSVAASAGRTPETDKRRGFFGRILQFFREIIAELKKVTTPTKKELANYVAVVLVFVVFMMLLIFGLDYLFGQAAFWIFGNGDMPGA